MTRRFSLLVVGLYASTLLACRREPEKLAATEAPKPAISSAVTAAPPPAPVPTDHGMPGALGLAAEEAPTTPAAAAVKSTGVKGDWLEGDVYLFKLLSVAPCGEAVDAKAATPASASGNAVPSRTVLGAKVRIQSKSRLNISPRDVTLQRGGITFYANVDPTRRLKGCTPLLKIASLRDKEAAEGFVLFDVPSPDLKGLDLEYRPTRWGGAGQVRVALEAR